MGGVERDNMLTFVIPDPTRHKRDLNDFFSFYICDNIVWLGPSPGLMSLILQV